MHPAEGRAYFINCGIEARRHHLNVVRHITEYAPLLTVALFLALAPPCFGQNHTASISMLAAINQARRAANRPGESRKIHPLRWDARLARAAIKHSLDMAARGHVSHVGSQGDSPLDRLAQAGVAWRAMGENLAKNVSPLKAEQALMDEPPSEANHRNNILNPAYNYAGVGIVRGKDGMVYITQEFAEEP